MSSPQAVVALAVVPDVSVPSIPARKRKITPSAEQSTPKHALIQVSPGQQPGDLIQSGRVPITPYFAPRQLFPEASARVVQQYTHAHPETEAATAVDEQTWLAKRVLLPFDLRDENVDVLEGEVCDMLRNVFPGTTAIGEGRHRSYLHFTVSQMPMAPWPLTIGGLPFTITDGTQGRGPLFPRQNLGNFGISICKDIDARREDFSDKDLQLLAAEIVKELPNLNLIEIIFAFDRGLYLVLDDEVNIDAIKSRLPGRIARCPTGYLNDRELHRPAWVDRKAKRFIEPRPMAGVVDNTAYEILRPGVMVCSNKYRDHGHPATLSTTSGVLVKNSANDVFMTGASHGIGDDETVYQVLPTGQRKIIGKAVQEIAFTDISLVQLEKDVEFVNEPFENYAGVAPKFTRLVEVSGERLQRMNVTDAFLNSPYTGNMEGVITMTSVKLETVSQHPRAKEMRYFLYSWMYMGQVEGAEQARVELPDGTCGSAIWNDDGVVIGFFHYYISEGPWAGWCASVSASELVDAGYRLVV